jgi:hypothetical protein
MTELLKYFSCLFFSYASIRKQKSTLIVAGCSRVVEISLNTRKYMAIEQDDVLAVFNVSLGPWNAV